MHGIKEGATMLHHIQQSPPTMPGPHSDLIAADKFFFARSNPIDNAAAAAAAAAAAGLIDPHRDLHNALVASITNSNVAAINGTLTTAAVLKSAAAAQAQQTQQQPQQQSAAGQSQQQQQQQTAGKDQAAAAAVQNAAITNGSQQQQQQQAAQQAALALLKVENVNATNAQNGSGANLSINSSSSGRSTPSNSGGSLSDPAPGKLFVGGLSWQTSSEKLKEYFNMFGTVTDVLIMKDPVTQVSQVYPTYLCIHILCLFYHILFMSLSLSKYAHQFHRLVFVLPFRCEFL